MLRLSICLLLLLVSASSSETSCRNLLDVSSLLPSGSHRYDGIGMIADATTKLLYSYEEPFRGQIIDYFYKPQFGASLDILKVEVGGDGQQGVGTSSSHQHTANEKPDFTRGMLWWLMREVQQRHQDVLFYGLAWTYPGWVQSAYSREAADYIATWLDGARQNNVSVSYIGLSQNERPPCATSSSCDSVMAARKAFDAHGHKQVKIVAPDAFQSPLPSDAEMIHNSQAASEAVDIWGIHGAAPLTELYGSVEPWMTQPGAKPLWNSENEAGYMGVRFLARALVRAYVMTNATGFISWPLTNGAFEHLPFMDNILPSHATQPWSGAYNISTHIWAFAHHTQFTQPGWLFDRAASRLLDGGGSVVTRRSPDGTHFAAVIETVPCEDMPVCNTCDIRFPPVKCPNATSAPQIVTIKVPTGVNAVAVWESDTRSDSDHSGWFLRRADLEPSSGAVTLSLPVGRLVTVTSQLNKGNKGKYGPPPAPSPFPVPYSVNFSQPSVLGSIPKFFLDQRGVFEVVDRPPYGRVLRQQAPEPEVVWIPGPTSPITIIGEWSAQSYRVSATVLLPPSSSGDNEERFIAIGGLVSSSGIAVNGNQPDSGIFLRISDGGNWRLQRAHGSGATLCNGTLPLAKSWRDVSLEFKADGRITAVVDGSVIANVHDGYYRNGWAALGCGWNECLYQTFRIEAVGDKALPKPGAHHIYV